MIIKKNLSHKQQGIDDIFAREIKKINSGSRTFVTFNHVDYEKNVYLAFSIYLLFYITTVTIVLKNFIILERI